MAQAQRQIANNLRRGERRGDHTRRAGAAGAATISSGSAAAAAVRCTIGVASGRMKEAIFPADPLVLVNLDPWTTILHPLHHGSVELEALVIMTEGIDQALEKSGKSGPSISTQNLTGWAPRHDRVMQHARTQARARRDKPAPARTCECTRATQLPPRVARPARGARAHARVHPTCDPSGVSANWCSTALKSRTSSADIALRS